MLVPRRLFTKLFNGKNFPRGLKLWISFCSFGWGSFSRGVLLVLRKGLLDFGPGQYFLALFWESLFLRPSFGLKDFSKRGFWDVSDIKPFCASYRQDPFTMCVQGSRGCLPPFPSSFFKGCQASRELF